MTSLRRLDLYSNLEEAHIQGELGKQLGEVCKFAVAPGTCDAPHSTFAATRGTFCVAPQAFFGDP